MNVKFKGRTVGDLLKHLSKYPQNAPLFIGTSDCWYETFTFTHTDVGPAINIDLDEENLREEGRTEVKEEYKIKD